MIKTIASAAKLTGYVGFGFIFGAEVGNTQINENSSISLGCAATAIAVVASLALWLANWQRKQEKAIDDLKINQKLMHGENKMRLDKQDRNIERIACKLGIVPE
jgi:hypothetical protein